MFSGFVHLPSYRVHYGLCMTHHWSIAPFSYIALNTATHKKMEQLRRAKTELDILTVWKYVYSKPYHSGFGGLGVACLSLVPKFAVGFFQGEKILSTPSLRGEVKSSVPCRRFTACKRSLNVTWKSDILRQNSSAISRPCSST